MSINIFFDRKKWGCWEFRNQLKYFQPVDSNPDPLVYPAVNHQSKDLIAPATGASYSSQVILQPHCGTFAEGKMSHFACQPSVTSWTGYTTAPNT